MDEIQVSNQLDRYLGRSIKILDDMKEYTSQDSISEVNLATSELEDVIPMEDCSFLKIESVGYDNEYPHREALENVLSTMDNPEFNFVYMITGTTSGIDIHIGAVKNLMNNTTSKFHPSDCAKKIKSSFEGNFQGSSLKKLSRDSFKDEVLSPMSKLKRASIISGIPSINESDKSVDFQGIDRLINSMSGVNWRLMVVCEPVHPTKVQDIRDDIYAIYEELHKYSKYSMQYGDNTSASTSNTRTSGSSRSKSTGSNESKSSGSSSGSSSSSKNSSTSRGTSQGTTEGTSDSRSSSNSESKGKSVSMTLDVINKKIQETLKYLDEELLERMRLGSGKGLFNVSIYALAENNSNLARLQSSISSIFQGNDSSFSPLHSKNIDDAIESAKTKMLCNFQNYTSKNNLSPEVPKLYSHPVYGNEVGLSTYMTAKELSIISGLPMKEVPGLRLKEGVEFGLNLDDVQPKEDKLSLGNMMHRGQVLKKNFVHISKKNLNKHMFIAGVTGSGKTTTCQKILMESNIPFWVIEPAKTEYRSIYKNFNNKDLMFFTIGNEKIAPFRFNPFEILPNESICSHVDMLKATFTTAFPMEASMPQILEEAMYECYEKYGWDIDDDTNRYSDDPWNENGIFFPTLSDLVAVLDEVVRSKKFGQELQSNYIGSLVSRISNLTVGSKGRMLNCKLSVDFSELIEKNVIIEMDDLKSPEDKALLMGFILSRLSEVIKLKHKKDKQFKHITLVEEAHRLLSKVEYGDSGSKKVSVEMFTDLLAEIRKYGESLIIVDQIPNKLAVEVLKNTNTKIIHKLFAKDDKEAIGDTMLMDDKQKEYLSSLQTGEAIVFSEGWCKPILTKIDRLIENNSNDVEDETIRAIGDKQKEDYFTVYQPWFNSSKVLPGDYKAVMSLKKDFDEILVPLRKNQLSIDDLNAFQDSMNRISSATGITCSDIWRQLAWNYSIERGLLRKSIAEKSNLFENLFAIYDTYLSRKDVSSDGLVTLSEYLD